MKNSYFLRVACDKGYLEVAQALIDAGGDVNLPIRDGATPLFLAAEKNRMDVVQFLLRSNADVDKSMLT